MPTRVKKRKPVASEASCGPPPPPPPPGLDPAAQPPAVSVLMFANDVDVAALLSNLRHTAPGPPKEVPISGGETGGMGAMMTIYRNRGVAAPGVVAQDSTANSAQQRTRTKKVASSTKPPPPQKRSRGGRKIRRTPYHDKKEAEYAAAVSQLDRMRFPGKTSKPPTPRKRGPGRPLGRKNRATLQREAATSRGKSDPAQEARIDAAIATVQSRYGTSVEGNKKLATVNLRGVTRRPSGKWQAQLHYAGKSRYLGVFPSEEKAALGYEVARELLKEELFWWDYVESRVGEGGPSAEDTEKAKEARQAEIEKQLTLARKAAWKAVEGPGK